MTEQTTLLENDIARLSENIAEQYAIDAHYFEDQSIKRGLRNADGTGVLIGVSKVGSVQGYYMMDGERVPMPGKLYYRGINVEDIVEGCRRENRRRRRPPSSSPRASRCPSPWTQTRHRPGSGGWQITSNRWSSPAAVTVMVPAARSPIYTGYVMQRASPSKHPRQGLCQCMHSLRRGCPVPPYPAEGRLSTTRSHPRLSVS